MASARLRYQSVPKVIQPIPIRKKTIRRILNPKSDPEIVKHFEISPPDYSFGPFYCPESKSSAEAKDRAWKKILEKEETDEENTNQSYLSAMRSVEKEARAAYGGDAALVDFTESEFRWMMIRDGCFFLQLMMFILNASGELDYPEDDPIFGKKRSTKPPMSLIKSMFLVGNQIPLVVLNKLMNQKFFRSFKLRERPSDMLSKQILYDLIVDPAKQKGKKHPLILLLSKLLNRAKWMAKWMAFWPMHMEKPSYYSSHLQKPSDLLHGLQLFLLGPATDKKFASPDEDSGDWSDDEFENEDIEAGITLKPNNNSYPSQSPNPNPEVLEKNKLSISNLTSKGMLIWTNISNCGGGGSRGIEFKSRILWGSLFLPPLKVNRDTNVLFTNLKYYEIVHKQKEVRSYINFLATLVSTYEDVNVLASNKIIDTKSEDKEGFLQMLDNLSDKEVVLITHRHQSVMGHVKDFNWQRFKDLAIVIFILTFIQTVFTVLGYFSGNGTKR